MVRSKFGKVAFFLSTVLVATAVIFMLGPGKPYLIEEFSKSSNLETPEEYFVKNSSMAIEVAPHVDTSFNVEIKNNGSNILKDVHVSLYGLSHNWTYRTEPDKLSRLEPGEMALFKVMVYTPLGAEENVYQILVEASAHDGTSADSMVVLENRPPTSFEEFELNDTDLSWIWIDGALVILLLILLYHIVKKD